MSERVPRTDVGALAAPVRTPEGFMKLEGRLARVGLQSYRDAQGKEFVELRLPQEVFAPESLSSFSGAPVTDTHPPGLLTADTATRYAVGSVGPARQDGDHIAAPVTIVDAAAIRSFEAGRTQLSVGYTCQRAAPDPSLFPTWGRHDAIQRDIVVNHCALVDVARCGPSCSLRADCAGCATHKPEKENTMLTNNATNSDEVSELKAKLAAAEGRAAGLEQRERIDEAAIRERYRADVAERVALELAARSAGLHAREIADAPDNAGLRIKILSKIAPRLDASGKSDQWVVAALEALGAALPTASEQFLMAMSPHRRRADGPPDPFAPASTPDEARRRMIERSREINAGRVTVTKDGGNIHVEASDEAPHAPQQLDEHAVERARLAMIERSREANGGKPWVSRSRRGAK